MIIFNGYKIGNYGPFKTKYRKIPDAENVAKEIKATGKKVSFIYVSHGDPDFYVGLEVFKKYFPEVTVYATAETVSHTNATAQKKLDVWGAQAGDAITKILY